VPVTAKLSRKFYERFGDELTNELVESFNQVDATYKSDLRELNELSFTRFEARFEAEIAQAVARLESRMSPFETRIIRWMFVFWVGTLGTLIALRRF
jgi:phosphate uptake regulator